MLQERLSAKTKLAYGITEFGTSIAYTVPSFFLLIFMTDVLKIPPALAGTILLISKIWDAIIDPTIGHLSDRTKSRLGRRRSFLFRYAIPLGLAFALMWFIPAGLSLPLKAALVLLVQIFYISFFSLVLVPYATLAAEMTADYDERTSLNSYRVFFSIIGGLIAVLVPQFFLDTNKGNLQTGYCIMGAFFGILMAILPYITVYGTREKFQQTEESVSFRESLRLAFANQPFIITLATYLVTWAAIDVISAVMAYYLQWWMGIPLSESGTILGIIFGAAALFLPLWVLVSKRFDKRESYIVGMSSLGLLLLGLIFLRSEHQVLLYVFAGLAGIGVSAAHIIPLSMIPDTIEYNELRFGQRQEGVFYGIVTFLQQLASSAALFLVGVILQFCGYNPDLPQQTATALWGIRILLGVFPGIMILSGIFFLRYYHINRQEHGRILQELAERRAAATLEVENDEPEG